MIEQLQRMQLWNRVYLEISNGKGKINKGYGIWYLLHLVPKTVRNNNHVIVMTTGNDTLKRRESQRREKENDQC